MKIRLTILLLLISTISFSQRTICGPNVGYISNTKDFKSNTISFGFSVRSVNKWKYAQPEINLTWNPNTSEFSEMRIPVLFGLSIMRTLRFNIGGELRSSLSFVGENKRGLNSLSYESSFNYVTAIAGFGIDFDRLCLDFRVTTQDNDFVNIKPQYTVSTSFLFGPRK